jgi:outer membrane protein OmpA-like peptidoglycan-associated protein
MIKTFSAFIISICSILVSYAQVIPGDYNKNYKAGEFHMLSEEPNLAIPYLVEAYKVKPSPMLAQKIYQCYIEIDDEDRILPYLKAAKEGGIKEKKMDFYFGRAYHKLHKFPEAIESYNAYLVTLKTNEHHETQLTQKYIQQCKYGMELMKNPQKVIIKNLGPNVNSAYPDYVPVVSADETVLIFTSRRDNTTGGKRDTDGEFMEDIYQSHKINDSVWSKPIDIGNGINTDSHDACVALSPDGMELILYRVTGSDGGDLYVSNLKGDLWSKPTKLGNTINTKYWEPSATITADEKVIFFTSNRDGGYGGRDIYMTKMLENGQFGPAILLGPKINTPEDEDSPFIHADGKTLYFSSKGHKTMGGFDIFSCTINTETGEILTDPVNIGYPINTAGDDVFFVWSADNKRAYFSSEREGGYGDKDLYMLVREEAKAALVMVKGQIIHCDGKKPVAATIKVTDLATQKLVGVYNSNASTGKYTVLLPAGKNYALAVEAPGYLFHSSNINIPFLEKYIEIVDTVCMNKIQVGKAIVLRNVFFDVNKSTLRPESVQELERLVTILKENPTIKIQISGHTDSDGNDDTNMKLSDDRAGAVVQYLISKGIDTKRLTFKGYGETKPIAPNDTPENKQLNRRTEFEIISQ